LSCRDPSSGEGECVTDRPDVAGGDASIVAGCVTRRKPRRWQDDKRAKGFRRGGPRKGFGYEMERLRVISPECEEAKQAYPLTMVAKRIGYKRASLKVILCKSGLPYLLVKEGPGPGTTYLPRSTVDALVARKIQWFRGRQPTTSGKRRAVEWPQTRLTMTEGCDEGDSD